MSIFKHNSRHGNRPNDWTEIILSTRSQSFACNCAGIVEDSNQTLFHLETGHNIRFSLAWVDFLDDLFSCSPVTTQEWVFSPFNQAALAEKNLLFIMKGDPENGRYIGLIIDFSESQAHNYPNTKAESLNILIVDDQLIYRKVFEKILQQSGYSCFHASNGKEALNELEKHSIDLVLLDFNMPKMDGKGTLQQIRDHGPDIPILAITARNDFAKLDQDDTYHYDGMIPKPPESAELIQKINIALNKNTPQTDPSYKWINLQYLHGIADGDNKLIQELIGLFLKIVPSTLEKMQKMCLNGDWDEIKNQAHKIKANFNYLGIYDLFEMTNELERIINNNKEKKEIESMIRELKDSTHSASEELREVLDSMV